MKKFLPPCPFAVPPMAQPSRRKIYQYLFSEGEKTVGEITKKLRLRQPTVSYHLKMMEKEGLITSQKKGREVYYKVALACPEGGVCFR